MIKINFAHMRRNEEIELFESLDGLNTAKDVGVRCSFEFSEYSCRTHVDISRYKIGFCLPGLGAATARFSIVGVMVAVNNPVCRSLGIAANIVFRSEAKVLESRRSASSRTCNIGHQ